MTNATQPLTPEQLRYREETRRYFDPEVATEKEMLALEASRCARDRFGRVQVTSARDGTYDP